MSGLIEQDSSIMMGKPVITGTRITVEHILREIAAGTSIEELLIAHPKLTKESISEALNYAADVLRETALKTYREISD
jgi:Uncharacterized conserved protein, COG2442